MRLLYALTVGLFVVVVAVAAYLTLSGGDDAKPASKTTAAEGKPVKVVISGTNDALEPVTEGGIAGEGTFKATGAITDSGWARGFRAMPNKDLILLRFVTKGRKGSITYLVNIHIDQQPVVARWKIESATKAYKGLHGEGKEFENPPIYSVVWLRGKVWR
jgi:hypothetical protein